MVIQLPEKRLHDIEREQIFFGFLSIITISEDGDDDGVDCNDDDVGEEKSFGFLSRQLHNRWPLAG